MIDLERVQLRLEAEGLTANAASQRAGLGRDYVRDLLRGKVREPSAARLRRLADALNCTTEYLTGEVDEPGKPVRKVTPESSPLQLPLLFRVRGGFFPGDDGALPSDLSWPVPIIDRFESFQWLEWVEDPEGSHPIPRDALLHVTRVLGTLETGHLVVLVHKLSPNLRQRTIRRVEHVGYDRYRLSPAIEGMADGVELSELLARTSDLRIQGRVIAIYQFLDARIAEFVRGAPRISD